MYSRRAFIFMSTCFLTVQHVNAGGNMAGVEKINGTSNDLDPQWPVKVIKCFEHEHVLKCFRDLLQEKTNTKVILDKIRGVAKVSVARGDASSGRLTVKKLLAVLDDWNEALSGQIKQEFKEILEKRQLYNVTQVAVNILRKGRDVFDITEHVNNETLVEERKMKKMQMNMKSVIPFLLVPGLLLAGFMPWVMPQLKMIVMTVVMMNQIAFSTALFSFVRGYIFDTTLNEHIFYINHGYKNEKHHPKHQKDFNHHMKRLDEGLEFQKGDNVDKKYGKINENLSFQNADEGWNYKKVHEDLNIKKNDKIGEAWNFKKNNKKGEGWNFQNDNINERWNFKKTDRIFVKENVHLKFNR